MTNLIWSKLKDSSFTLILIKSSNPSTRKSSSCMILQHRLSPLIFKWSLPDTAKSMITWQRLTHRSPFSPRITWWDLISIMMARLVLTISRNLWLVSMNFWRTLTSSKIRPQSNANSTKMQLLTCKTSSTKKENNLIKRAQRPLSKNKLQNQLSKTWTKELTTKPKNRTKKRSQSKIRILQRKNKMSRLIA